MDSGGTPTHPPATTRYVPTVQTAGGNFQYPPPAGIEVALGLWVVLDDSTMAGALDLLAGGTAGCGAGLNSAPVLMGPALSAGDLPGAGMALLAEDQT